jgi:hypothetical protein
MKPTLGLELVVMPNVELLAVAQLLNAVAQAEKP